MNQPKPHDPSSPQVDAEQISRAFSELLETPAEDLDQEVDLLTRAHSLLQDALRHP